MFKIIKLDKHEQQIVLACKYHGVTKNCNRIDIIKNVISEWYSLNLVHINDEVLYKVLWSLAYKLKCNIEYIIENLFQDSWTGERKQFINREHIIKKLISEISVLKVIDENGNKLIELSERKAFLLNS